MLLKIVLYIWKMVMRMPILCFIYIVNSGLVRVFVGVYPNFCLNNDLILG